MDRPFWMCLTRERQDDRAKQGVGDVFWPLKQRTRLKSPARRRLGFPRVGPLRCRGLTVYVSEREETVASAEGEDVSKQRAMRRLCS